MGLTCAITAAHVRMIAGKPPCAQPITSSTIFVPRHVGWNPPADARKRLPIFIDRLGVPKKPDLSVDIFVVMFARPPSDMRMPQAGEPPPRMPSRQRGPIIGDEEAQDRKRVVVVTSRSVRIDPGRLRRLTTNKSLYT